MSEPVTIAALREAAPVLSISKLAEAAGMPAQTLHTRLRRGVPEFTPEESDALVRGLGGFGVVLMQAPRLPPR